MVSSEIAGLFAVRGDVLSCERYGNGHINETYLVKTANDSFYILQKINRTVFPDVSALMGNIAAVTRYLAKKDPDPRHTLTLVLTRDGKDYLMDGEDAWRMYDFVRDSLCLEAAESNEDFYQSAVAFGNFQRQLAQFPAGTLNEILPGFHDTPKRYAQLHEAMAEDRLGRMASVKPELDFALEKEAEASALMDQLRSGTLPLRVTHNDTKLNNVLLDAKSRKPLCVIDLDTVMPGLMAFDFGDSIRFGASTAAEDEQNLDRVEMSLSLYETYARGFIGTCAEGMTQQERESLPVGAKLMTLECGIRFLADYLKGDVYFHIDRPDHNLDRCRTQFKLVSDMEDKWDKMLSITRQVHA